MLKYFLPLIFIMALAPAKAQPTFKGGPAALDAFLQSKIVYPEFSSQNCIAAAVQVSFMIQTDGRVTDAMIQQGPGIDLDDEALRVIKLTSGKWNIPADYKRAVRVVLPISFRPDYVRCQRNNGTSVPQMSMGQAIAAYQKRQELENAITNYYINKRSGKADERNESTIERLKQQLGINEELWKDVLDQANEKLKQGDKDGACKDWNFIKNTGSSLADDYLARYCK